MNEDYERISLLDSIYLGEAELEIQEELTNFMPTDLIVIIKGQEWSINRLIKEPIQLTILINQNESRSKPTS